MDEKNLPGDHEVGTSVPTPGEYADMIAELERGQLQLERNNVILREIALLDWLDIGPDFVVGDETGSPDNR